MVQLDRAGKVLLVARVDDSALMAYVMGELVYFYRVDCDEWPTWSASQVTASVLASCAEFVSSLNTALILDTWSKLYQIGSPPNFFYVSLSKQQWHALISTLSEMYLEYAP